MMIGSVSAVMCRTGTMKGYALRKKLSPFLLAMLLLLGGCGEDTHADASGAGEEPVTYTSEVSAEDCYLCGDTTDSPLYPYWGQNNIGIVSLNTFAVMPVEINRYDMEGSLLEEQTGVLTSHSFRRQEDGFSAHMMEDVDYGYADGSISLYGDKALDVEQAGALLCGDCLNALMDGIYKTGFGVGLVNFETRELVAFEENTVGFGMGDFRISCGFSDPDKNADTRKISLLIFYAPLRYPS